VRGRAFNSGFPYEEQTFALPVTNVLRVIHLRPDQIEQAGGRETICIDDRPIVLVRLAHVLDLPERPADRRTVDQQPAIILGASDRRLAFLVDNLGAAQEIFIKNLPEPLMRVRHIAGATILGNGEVVVVLNVADLVRTATQMKARSTQKSLSKITSGAEMLSILVADDSITTRTLEKNILEAAGYQVQVVADGLEAWQRLQTESYHLLISDLMMPRMDGFELTAKIRGDDRLKNLPVILVTSLDSRQDCERGIAVGADAYLVKTAFDQEILLKTVQRLI